MGETSKLRAIRETSGWFTKYMPAGSTGIDIGCGDDPVTTDCRQWDLVDGDAQLMEGVPDASFDWVYSSHCLEHLHDPSAALARWWEILKPGGHLIVLVPDEDLYEQSMWPPHFNIDHKSTWTINKSESWSPVCRNLAHEFGLLPTSRILSLQILDTGYDYNLYQAVVSHVVVPRPLAQIIQDKDHNLLVSDLAELKIDNLKSLGFYPVDQSGPPHNAQISIEGIAQKRGHA